MPNPLYVYIVIVNDDGSINIDNTVPDGLQVARTASTRDILDSSRKINSDLEHNLLVEDVVRSMGELFPPAVVTPSPADRMRAALAERAATASQVIPPEVDDATADAQKDDPEV